MQIFISHCDSRICRLCGLARTRTSESAGSTLISRMFHTCIKHARACIDIATAGMNDVKFNAANLSRRTPSLSSHMRARTHAQA